MLEGQDFTPAATRPPLAILRALPPGPLAAKYERLKRLAELFERFDRDDMEAGVDLLLAELDARDGDADVEANGDELDGTNAEDEEGNNSGGNWLLGAGCPISDPGELVGDEADTCNAEDEVPALSADQLWWQQRRGPGCSISDPGISDREALDEDYEPDGRHIRLPHRDYIRARRCIARRRWGVIDYYLKEE